jgi:polysaccharide export outer membrane protein
MKLDLATCDKVPLQRRMSGPSVICLALAANLLAGCASLPVSGPTGGQIEQSAREGARQFRIVELTALDQIPPVPGPAVPVRPDLPPPPSDMIGVGDVLDIAVYEAGVTLFAGGARNAATASPGGTGVAGGAQAEHLPLQRVTDDGYVRVPYAGKLRAAGHTPEELGEIIRNRLKGLSQNPQVMVSVASVVANSVIVGGEVARPGRLVLNTNRETLSDVVALAGGYRGEAKDLSVRITRRGSDYEFRLSDVLRGADGDMAVLPGDRIEVSRKPQSYAVLGAPNRVDRVVFAAPTVSLAEAVAGVGGPNPQAGNAKAIFVFRFVNAEAGETPIVYHLNMMNPGAYFLSQRFAMRDKDVLYVGNAGANQTTKMVQLISQLFSPALSAAVVAQNAVN